MEECVDRRDMLELRFPYTKVPKFEYFVIKVYLALEYLSTCLAIWILGQKVVNLPEKVHKVSVRRVA